MRRLRRHRPSPAVAVSIIAVTVALGGVAYATIPSSGSVIHSCYNAAANPSGALRVIDTDAGAKCTKNEKALNFNQTGIQGPKGDTGETGATGPAGTSTNGTPGATGATGPSDAYFTGPFNDTTGASVSVPAGSYAITATAVVQNGDEDSQNASCVLAGRYHWEAGIPGRSDVGITIQDVATYSSGTTIRLQCSGFAISAAYGSITAIKVGAIHNQTPSS